MTTELFREDSYLKQCTARVVDINDRGGIRLDQTVFYPTGGGQPGDSGELVINNEIVKIATTIKDRDSGIIWHVAAEDQHLPQKNTEVIAKINWTRRHQLMRMHTALHLLCAVVPCGVTGGQIGELKSRLDFDVGEEKLDKESINEKINQLIQADHNVSFYWITNQELETNPNLVRTLSVKPPKGSGKVRLLKVGDNVDLQPCGGTHVKSTIEIGKICISKIENKGKHNRRVHVVFTD